MSLELALFVRHAAMLVVGNYLVYHALLLQTCNFTVFAASLFGLSGRLLAAQYAELKRTYPDGLDPLSTLLWTALAAQVAGTAAWLARRLVETQRLGKLLLLLGLPLMLWLMLRQVVLRVWRDSLVAVSPSIKEGEDVEGLRRYQYQLTVHVGVSVLETALFNGYVVGLLPALFASDPHLFFDWQRCIGVCISVMLSSGVLLLAWALLLNISRLHSMWCVLGWWKRVDSATVAERSWDASTAYALGTLVKFGGRSWQAMGPAYNMATPGSHAAGLSHWLMQNPVRVFDALLLCQLALVTYHALFAWGSCHWIADAAMAVLNYPGVFFILHARGAAVTELQRKIDQSEQIASQPRSF